MISQWLGERVLLELQLTRAAAEQARSVAGVVRLQPGLWGLVRQFSADLWRQATGEELGDTAGVEVDVREEQVQVRISLVTDARDQTVAVVGAVQRAVYTAVTEVVDDRPVVVEVYVADIDISGLDRDMLQAADR